MYPLNDFEIVCIVTCVTVLAVFLIYCVDTARMCRYRKPGSKA